MKFRLRLSNPVRAYLGVEAIVFKDCTSLDIREGKLTITLDSKITKIATIVDTVPDTVFYRVDGPLIESGLNHPMDFRSLAIELQRP